MNDKINILRDAIDNNKLTIFVGAGISMSSGFPRWSELMKKIKKEINSAETDETDYLKLAQFYYQHKTGKNNDDSEYYKGMSELIPNDKKPSDIYKLIFEIKPRNIITTNWDNLLERSAEKEGYVYETIVKDDDLVESLAHNYIIKMHGDIENKNIVFKESDYLNYSENFPLIENYVKSILSTNIILFMGYSYSDINLKYIIKWLQNNAKIHPKMFLLNTSENKDEHQSLYLKNYGIEDIFLKEKDTVYNNIDDDHANKIATFLDKILNPNKIKDIDTASDKKVLEYFYKKLEPLDSLNATLPEQVQSLLTNCGFRYDLNKKGEGLIILRLHEDIMNYNLNPRTRKLNKKFNSFIKNHDNNKNDEVEKIFDNIISILCNAGINGILFEEDKFSKGNMYFETPINISIENILSYNFDSFHSKKSNIDALILESSVDALILKSFILYQKRKYYESYKLVKHKIIPLCFKEHKYIQLFFAMYNHNVLLKILNTSYYSYHGNSNDDYNKKWQYNTSEYDLESEYYELPTRVQKSIKYVKILIKDNCYYTEIPSWLSNKLNNEIKDKEKNTSYYQSNMGEYLSKRDAILKFYLKNLLILEAPIFSETNKDIINIKLKEKFDKYGSIKIQKTDLFYCIRYISTKELQKIFFPFLDKKIKLNIPEDDLKWLTNEVLPNISKLFNNNEEKFINSFHSDFENTLFILSLVKLGKSEMDSVFFIFEKAINTQIIGINIYEIIDQFLFTQLYLFDEEINSNGMVDVIKTIINKIISGKTKSIDYYSFVNNNLNDLFYCLGKQKEKNYFREISLVKKLMKKLKSLNTADQLRISQSFLISLHYISSLEIQEIIEKYINSIQLSKSEHEDYSEGLVLSCKLSLVINKINAFNKEFINEIDDYLVKFKEIEGNFNFFRKLTGQIKYLYQDMGISELEERYIRYKSLLESLNDRSKGQD